jgi:outer membrane protein assembly factor BamD
MKAIGAALLLSLFVVASGCGVKSHEVVRRGTQGDERLMALGRQKLDDEKWNDARGYFQQLLDAYPRSQFAGDARLGVADTYFNQSGRGNLILAIAEYRDFLTFFPNHPRADYAQYQIGFGHYKQTHSPDRDQEPTELAIEEFEKLTELYRNSRYADEGRVLLAECYETIAESLFRKGLFYLENRKACKAAIARFQTVLDQYPTFSKKDELHFRLGFAYQMCQDAAEAMPHLQQVLDEFPDSTFREDAQGILATLQVENTSSNP